MPYPGMFDMSQEPLSEQDILEDALFEERYRKEREYVRVKLAQLVEKYS